MKYYVKTKSFAAPFFSDTGEQYVEAESPRAALKQAVAAYSHPCGLYSAAVWASHEASMQDKPLLRWDCNHELAKQKATKDMGAYTYYGHGPGEFTIGDQLVHVRNPKGGRIVEPTP